MDESEDATDVTDLAQARRIIAVLRRSLVDLEEMSRPAHGEYSVFLDDEHADLLRMLFLTRKLVDDQDEDWELDEVLTQFVSNWLEVQYDMVRALGAQPPTIAPSA